MPKRSKRAKINQRNSANNGKCNSHLPEHRKKELYTLFARNETYEAIKKLLRFRITNQEISQLKKEYNRYKHSEKEETEVNIQTLNIKNYISHDCNLTNYENLEDTSYGILI